jgi:hypothetical protein
MQTQGSLFSDDVKRNAKSKDLKSKILKLLAIDLDTRDNDIYLTYEIWKKFFPDLLKTIDGKFYVALDNLHYLPREDDVKRIRARIQNKMGLFPPTNWLVAKKRFWKQQTWLQRVREWNKNDRNYRY